MNDNLSFQRWIFTSLFIGLNASVVQTNYLLVDALPGMSDKHTALAEQPLAVSTTIPESGSNNH
jgi:hypothetical protein